MDRRSQPQRHGLSRAKFCHQLLYPLPCQVFCFNRVSGYKHASGRQSKAGSMTGPGHHRVTSTSSGPVSQNAILMLRGRADVSRVMGLLYPSLPPQPKRLGVVRLGWLDFHTSQPCVPDNPYRSHAHLPHPPTPSRSPVTPCPTSCRLVLCPSTCLPVNACLIGLRPPPADGLQTL